MHTTFIQHTKGLVDSTGYASDAADKTSAFKALLVQIKQHVQARVEAIVQAPAQLPQDVRQEMYW